MELNDGTLPFCMATLYWTFYYIETVGLKCFWWRVCHHWYIQLRLTISMRRDLVWPDQFKYTSFGPAPSRKKQRIDYHYHSVHNCWVFSHGCEGRTRSLRQTSLCMLRAQEPETNYVTLNVADDTAVTTTSRKMPQRLLPVCWSQIVATRSCFSNLIWIMKFRYMYCVSCNWS